MTFSQLAIFNKKRLIRYLEMLAFKYILDLSLSSRLEDLLSDDALYRSSNIWLVFYALSDQASITSAAINGNPVAQNALGNSLTSA